MAVLRSRVSAGSGRPTSGVWHRRTRHPISIVNSVIGVNGCIWVASVPWRFRAALTRSPSIASVRPDSDLKSASSRSSSSCPSGG
eukprot:5571936-Pleurochrysis_carterae.AAC.1